MLDVAQVAGASSVVLGALGIAAHGTFVPSSRIWGRLVSHGNRTGPPRVALTFDDGPTPGTTDRVLTILSELNVKAAFFVIGRNAARHPELLERLDGGGHLIGNHSFDHSHWAVWGPRSYWRKQIEQTDQIIEQRIGRRPALFRPPVGIKTWLTMGAARDCGQTVVTWSLRGLDGVATTAERIIERVVRRASPGDIVSLHDGIEPNMQRDPSATLESLPRIITGLRERGLTPVRLDELANLPAYLPSAQTHGAASSVGGA